MQFDRMRRGQRMAFEVLRKRIASGESLTAIQLPTRYGKSDLIRVAAHELKSLGMIGGTVALCPGLWLQEQLVAGDKVMAMATRYGMVKESAMLLGKTNPFTERPFCNREYLLSMTIQAATTNIAAMGHLASKIKNSTRSPLMVVIDECHETSAEKRRGELVSTLVSAGAHVVLMTATAVRADGEAIPGFEWETLSEEASRKYVSTDLGDGLRNKVDVYDGVKRLVRLKAHHETTFHDAWKEVPSPLCLLQRKTISVILSDIDSDAPSKELAELSPSEARRYLGRAARHPKVISEGARLFVEDMELRRRTGKKWAGMVFTDDDNEYSERPNEHAELVRDAINASARQCGLKLRSIVATQKSEDDAKDAIRQFTAAGVGDVLIVKNMGGAGLDCDRIKTGLDLSSVRTVASCVQRFMRVATPTSDAKIGTVITLSDPLSNAIWEDCIVREGGLAVQGVGCEYELTDSYETEKKDRPDTPPREVIDAKLEAVFDNYGNQASPGEMAFAELLVDKFPVLGVEHTTPDIASRLKGVGVERIGGGAAVCTANTLDSRICDLQSQINARAKKLATLGGNYEANKSEWAKRLAKVYCDAKQHAGIAKTVELEQVRDVRALERMAAYLRGAKR